MVKEVYSPALNLVMHYWASSFFIVLPAIAIYLFYKKDKNVFVFAIAVVLLYVIADLIKMLVKEPRPCDVTSLSWINTYGCEGGYSFPSDHAMTLTGLALFINNYKYLRVLYLAWLIMVLFGRVYLGQHYFTDVVAGAVLSMVGAGILYKCRNWINTIGGRILYRILGSRTPEELRG